MVYFFLLVSCILAFIISKNNVKSQKTLAFIFLSVMMVLVGIRDPTVGVDSERYAAKLYFAKDVTMDSYEPLFQLSINFVNETWGTVLAWFLYLSFLAYFFYTISVLRYSVNPILSVLVFMVSFTHVFPDTMNNLRQGISIMILLLAYLTFSERKWIPGVILFLAAAGFHMSTWFTLPFLIWGYYLFLSPQKITVTLVVTFIIGLIGVRLVNISSVFQNISLASGVFMEGVDKFSGYTEGSYVLNWAGQIMVMLPMNILCYLLIPDDSDERSYKYLFNIYFFGIVLGNLLAGTVSFAMRYLVLFLVVESIIVAYKYRTTPRLKPFLCFMILFYCIYLIGIANKTEPGMIIPYKINPELLKIF